MAYGLDHVKSDSPEQVFQCGTNADAVTLEGINA